MKASFVQTPVMVKAEDAAPAPLPALMDDRRGESDVRFAGAVVRRVGEKRVSVRLGEMGPVEGIGVGSVGERIAEAMQGEPGSLGPELRLSTG